MRSGLPAKEENTTAGAGAEGAHWLPATLLPSDALGGDVEQRGRAEVIELGPHLKHKAGFPDLRPPLASRAHLWGWGADWGSALGFSSITEEAPGDLDCCHPTPQHPPDISRWTVAATPPPKAPTVTIQQI